MTDAAAAPPLPVGLADVEAAADRLSGVANHTPVLTARRLDERTGARIHLKAEHLQRIGAFKFRGAYNAIVQIPPEDRAAGVVAWSSGNHAQAVACAAGLLGCPATIVMPEDAPEVKVAATRSYGAEVVGYDRYTEDRREIGRAIAVERGATVIPPFDHPDVIAGQGTATLELIDAVPDLDLLVVPVGGGGLLSGAAVAARGRLDRIEIVGVEPAERRAARDALAGGQVVEVPVPRTVLDGQQTPEIGHGPLAIFERLVDRVLGVEDDLALATVRTLAIRTKQVVEPSGASALAAILGGELDVTGRRVGVILSGGNIEPQLLARTVAGDGPLRW